MIPETSPSTSLQLAKEDLSATTIKRYWKGYSIRKKIILPHQITPFLNKTLSQLVLPIEHYSRTKSVSNYFKNVKTISKCLAREINKINHIYNYINPLEWPKYTLESSGHAVRIPPSANLYPHPIFDENNKYLSCETTFFPFSTWLIKNADQNSVEIQISPENISPAGSGSLKKVICSLSLSIPIEKPELSTSRKTVLLRSRAEEYESKENQKANIQTVLEGYWHLVEIRDKLEPLIAKNKIKFPPLPRIKPPFQAYTVEFEQEWLGSSLDKVLVRKSTAVSIDGICRKKVNAEDLLNILIDVAETLEAIHTTNNVHKDVKPQNIMVPVSKDGKIHGIISDFDLACEPGIGPRFDYAFWDTLTCCGYVTPFCDVYGLAITLGYIFLGKWFENLICYEGRDLNRGRIVNSILDKKNFFLTQSINENIWYRPITRKIFNLVYDVLKNDRQFSTEYELPVEKKALQDGFQGNEETRKKMLEELSQKVPSMAEFKQTLIEIKELIIT